MLTSKADKYFSRFIRLRDSDKDGIGTCCTCGTRKPIKEMDCGHFQKRQHMATRFSEMNCAAQCKNCNAFEQGRNESFERFLVKRYGQDKVDLLKFEATKTRKISQFEIDQIAEYYKRKATELSKEKNVKWW